MTNTSTNRMSWTEAIAPVRDYIHLIREREDELRLAGVFADYRIWPTGPVGRAIFEPGMTVAAFVGPTTRPAPDRVRVLSELCRCLKGRLIEIRHPTYHP